MGRKKHKAFDVEANLDQSCMIGEINHNSPIFPETEQCLNEFKSEEFQALNSIVRNETVNRKLFDIINNLPAGSYCFREVIHYLKSISDEKVLDGNFNLTAFERWINQHSGLSYEENRILRGKITGKYVPREEFQSSFPIGKDKVHPGSHTVTAHNPPDLDSTTASFIGWLDAFSCRVGSSLTVWNVPQGKPGPLIAKLFEEVFTDDLFYRVAKHKTLISHVAMDVVKQDRLIRVSGDTNIRDFSHNRNENHIILIRTNPVRNRPSECIGSGSKAKASSSTDDQETSTRKGWFSYFTSK